LTPIQLPGVDILIAAKNEERYLGACLEALERQDYPKESYRIYVIDNGSSDNTVRIAQQHDVQVLSEPKGGAAAARNAGLAQSCSELVGFLDAHCVPEKNWIRLMAEQFEVAELGGCQGRIENKSVNERVQKYLNDSGVLSNERVLVDTISGKRNIYPWILSGNCMYRREALNEAGFFNQKLEACEDVDLAWRVVLLGYQLAYVPEAKLVHYDCDSWHDFLKKGLSYGRGAATLAAIYKPHGAREKFLPKQIWSRKPERLLSGLYYWAGYRQKEWRLRLQLDKPPGMQPHRAVLGKFRPAFQWTSNVSLRVSSEAIFWLRDDEQTSVIVHVPTKLRFVLDAVGDFIWRRVARGINKEAIVEQLSKCYGVAPVTAAADLDDLIEELIEVGILVREFL
jgi:cellulose synthase/poly-beta-1,6-N-acetylglucosamine synthase-like glycosyltransferase